MRNLYRRWAQFMEAESWGDLMAWRLEQQMRGQPYERSGINVRDLAVGARLMLTSGAEVEIVVQSPATASGYSRDICHRPMIRRWPGWRR